MKVIVAFAMLIAGISALPSFEKQQLTIRDQRLITDAIASAIEDVSQSIRDAGLDPLHIKRETTSYALPVPVIFNAAGFVEELLSTGLSNIVINNINFSVLTTRLTFDIELPLISASVDTAAGEATVFGSTYTAQAAGGVGIQRIRVVGNVRVNVGIISGITIRSIDINFTLGGIISNMNLVIHGTDYSSLLNTFLSTTIPNTLTTYSSEVNELIEIIALDIINDLL